MKINKINITNSNVNFSDNIEKIHYHSSYGLNINEFENSGVN